MNKPMRNFNFLIPDELDDRLKAESKASGVPMSEIVRRAIDAYLLDANTFNDRRRSGAARPEAMAEAVA